LSEMNEMDRGTQGKRNKKRETKRERERERRMKERGSKLRSNESRVLTSFALLMYAVE